jgi:hypothetical protein
MSLELAAKHLASRGRKGDTMLVHMAPEEVSGLQALARAGGGSLTLNPDTGLPEANFLKRLLPTLIGAGLMFATGGTAAPLIAGISNPALIGLGIGGLETARTGSLGKGLMAGLGAYGGAGLTGSLMGAGAAGAGAAGAGTTGAAGAGASIPPTNYGLLPQSQYALAAPAGGEGLRLGASEGLKASASGLGTDLGGSLANLSTPSIPAIPPTLGERFASGLGNLGSKDIKFGLAAATPMMQPDAAKPYVDGGPNYEYTYDSATGQYNRVPVGTRNTLTQLPRMFADGGPVEAMSDRNQMQTLMANGGQMFAAGGGVSHLGDYSDGGRLLKGPGDGVSDSIPATIADKRPARLADGEFVVPARIVSELGNGSTDAGARKLYAMMDRIQKARGKTTGKNRVAVNSKAERLLPA